ncbi:solute carrier family 22 member 14-like, partial [Pseudorca crassidens]|uniref:solute carrier family 22 member 14-like n=1 Tax=Pseudorca crassidens TaxID=82174 RepID=UPI00352EE220
RATGLGLLSLVWAAGGISSLIVVNQNIAILPVFLCCISAFVALFFCVKLPETQDQPIPDSLEHLPPERRTLSEDMSSEDMLCDDVTEEVAKNTIFNATMTNMDQDSLSNLSLQSGEGEIDKTGGLRARPPDDLGLELSGRIWGCGSQTMISGPSPAWWGQGQSCPEASPGDPKMAPSRGARVRFIPIKVPRWT